MARNPWCTASLVAAFASLTVGPFAAAAGAGDRGGRAGRRSAFDRPLNAFDASAVERARAGAARRLQDPECLKVLTEFTDGEGRTLDHDLETWGVSAAEYVLTLPFREGAAMKHCRDARVALVTFPGLPRVYVCPGRVGPSYSLFAWTTIQNHSLADAMVIHEMLHTLGLGENPPSSVEITDRVQRRCR